MCNAVEKNVPMLTESTQILNYAPVYKSKVAQADIYFMA